MRWSWVGQIIHVVVTVLTVIWLYLLTDWVNWIDLGQDVIVKALDQLREELQRFKI